MTYRPRVLVVYGTRPEAVKVAPVVLALRRDPDLQALVVDTGQHPDLTAAVHDTFGTHPDCTLSIARPGQSVGAIAARTMTEVGSLLAEWRPDLVLVHGDTTAAAATALAAHYAHLPVAHLEAGLRSGDLWSPWPEEANRSVIGRLAGLHLAPTETAKDNLLREGVPAEHVVVTGNTVVDALLHTLDQAHRTCRVASRNVRRRHARSCSSRRTAASRGAADWPGWPPGWPTSWPTVRTPCCSPRSTRTRWSATPSCPNSRGWRPPW